MLKKELLKILLKIEKIDYFREFQLLKNLKTEEEILLFQKEKLFALLDHAQKQVLYYSLVINNRMSSNKSEYEVLSDLPILTKEIIRTKNEELIAADSGMRKIYANQSSGSTGEPVRLIQDIVYQKWANATNYYYYDRFLNLDENQIKKIVLWGSRQDIKRTNYDIKNKIWNFLTNTIFINSFVLDENSLEETIKRINSKKPDLIRGYAGSLYELGIYVYNHKRRIHRLGAIISSAEVLTDGMREIIENAFGCRVYNFYGSREVGPIAGECSEGNLHLFNFYNYTEIIDDDDQPVGEGQEGRVIVTNLFNYSMPLIRYDIGDKAIRGPDTCPCGCTLPTIKEITGRISEHFVREDGSLVHRSYFSQLFHYKDWIHSFQIIQEEVKEIKIFAIVKGSVNEEDRQKIDEGIRSVLGDDCSIEWCYVNEIPKTTSGKHLFVISHVNRKSYKKK